MAHHAPLDPSGHPGGLLGAYPRRGPAAPMLAPASPQPKAPACRMMHIGTAEENRILRRWYETAGFIHTGTNKYDFFPFTCGYTEKVQ